MCKPSIKLLLLLLLFQLLGCSNKQAEVNLDSIRIGGVSANASYEEIIDTIDPRMYEETRGKGFILLSAHNHDTDPRFIRLALSGEPPSYESAATVITGSSLNLSTHNIMVGDPAEKVFKTFPQSKLRTDSIDTKIIAASIGEKGRLEFILTNNEEVSSITFKH